MIPITSNADNSQRFYHFPIYCFRDCGMNSKPEERKQFFQRVIAFVLVEIANHIERDWEPSAVDAKAQRFSERYGHPLKTYADQCFAVSHEVMGVTCPTWDYKKKREIHKSLVGRFGHSRVSINTTYFWECNESYATLDWREFSILCGVYAAIGRDPAKCIKYDRIAAMAAGFSSERELDAANKEFGWKVKTYTRKQVRDTVAKLERRNFFLTASPDGRRKYYTTQLRPFERLAAYLVKAAREREKRNAELSQSERTKYIQQLLNSPNTPE